MNNNIIVKNPYRFYAFPSLIFGIIFQIIFYLSFIFEIESLHFLFAFSLIFSFLGVLLIILGQIRVKQIKDIINGKDLITVWEIPEDLWKKYLLKEYDYNKKDAVSTLFGFLLAGTLLAIFAFDVFNYYMLLTGTIMGVVIYYILKSHNNNILKIGNNTSLKVFMAYTGVYIGETFHYWNLSMSGLTDIFIIENYFETNDSLCFSYAIEGKRGPIYKVCNVPIPFDKKNEALEIVKNYQLETNKIVNN